MNRLNTMLKSAGAALRKDSAENSIMQTISIAVSAILIAAGLITAPSLINNAKDTNAKSDLANVSYSEEFFNSSGGAYVGVAGTAATGILTPATFAAGANTSGDGSGNVKISFASKTSVGIKLDATAGYVAVIQSASGNYFARIGTGSATINFGKTIPTAALLTAAVPAGFGAAAFAAAPTFAAGDLTLIP